MKIMIMIKSKYQKSLILLIMPFIPMMKIKLLKEIKAIVKRKNIILYQDLIMRKNKKC
jgi:hypothetical protein